MTLRLRPPRVEPLILSSPIHWQAPGEVLLRNLVIKGGPGNDTIDLTGLALSPAGWPTATPPGSSLWGNGGSDTIDGWNYFDRIFGGAGHDKISGHNGNDMIIGQNGIDTIFGGAGNDFIRGNAGQDAIDGGIGNDTLFGDDSFDIIKGQAGNDTIDSGAGNDLIEGGTGVDTITAGTGADIIWSNFIGRIDQPWAQIGGTGTIDGSCDMEDGKLEAPPECTPSTLVAVNDAAAITTAVPPVQTDINVWANDTLPANTLPLVFVTSGPTSGTAVGYVNRILYTPNPGFTGTDTFKYRNFDSATNSYSNEATVTVTVANAKPAANNGSMNIAPGTSMNYYVDASDPDGHALELGSISNVGSGISVSIVGGLEVMIDADPSFTGDSTFDFVVTDGFEESDPATVTVSAGTTTPDPVEAVEDWYNGWWQNDTLFGNVLGNDIGNNLAVSLVNGPAHGTLALASDGSFTYTPNGTYVGDDTFEYEIDDGVSSDTAIVTIALDNDPPTVEDDFYVTSADTPLLENVLENDFDADPLIVAPGTGVSNGTLELLADGSFTYTPYPGFVGTDTFSYSVTDGIESTAGYVTINVENWDPMSGMTPLSGGGDPMSSFNIAGSHEDDEALLEYLDELESEIGSSMF